MNEIKDLMEKRETTVAALFKKRDSDRRNRYAALFAEMILGKAALADVGDELVEIAQDHFGYSDDDVKNQIGAARTYVTLVRRSTSKKLLAAERAEDEAAAQHKLAVEAMEKAKAVLADAHDAHMQAGHAVSRIHEAATKAEDMLRAMPQVLAALDAALTAELASEQPAQAEGGAP